MTTTGSETKKSRRVGRDRHKKKERRCPICGEVKEFPVRNAACGKRCADELKRQKVSESNSDSTEEQTRTENEWSISLKTKRPLTQDDMIALYEVDLNIWRVDRFVTNNWEGYRKDKQVSLTWDKGVMDGFVEDSGKLLIEKIYQSKLLLVRKVEVVDARNEIEELKAVAQSAVKSKPFKVRRSETGPYLLELSIPDVHIGRLARGDETGWDNYDTEIAKLIFDDAVETLVDRTSAFRFKKVCFVVGNDVLNADNLEGTTTRGTPQANDSRYHKVFATARNSLILAIERLRNVSPVDVIIVSGNHDKLGAWHLGDSLEAYFHTYSDVSIDNTPAPRKYHRFGNVMLMFAHSKKNKADYPSLMAVEQPEMFGATRYREVHLGDKHHVRLEEQHGVRLRILPSLAAPDNWTSDHEFVGSLRGAEAYVWHEQDGLVSTAYYTVSDKFAKNGRPEKEA